MAAFQEADFIPWRSTALINVPLLLAVTQRWPNPAHNATFYLSVTTAAKHLLCIFAYMEDWQTQPMSLNTEYDSLQSKIALCFIIYSELPKNFLFMKTNPLFKKRTIPRIPGCWLIKLVICAIKACTWISFVKPSSCTKWHVSKYRRVLQHRGFCI